MDLTKQIILANKIGLTKGFNIETHDNYNLVRTTRNFQTKETVLTSKCINILTKSDRYTLQKSTTHHIYMDAPSIFINHSCDPNLGIRDNQYNAYDFIAIKPIYANDELTFDYETAEETVDFFDKCLCASKQCRKSIIGFKHYEDIIRKKYGDFIADYLKK